MVKPLQFTVFTLAAIGIASLCGCFGDEIKANQQQLQQQQAELDQLKQQIAALQTQTSTSVSGPLAPGSCDDTVMREASRKGGERFAAGDFNHALAYYTDAVTACPKSSRAQLNLARTYESIGDRTEALAHYRLAAQADDSSGNAPSQARAAIARLRP
jgi:tetratricopeptide (TPR) repeat protein